MGAESIYFTVDGKLSRTEIDAKIRSQREEDRHRNGHQEGYSGDWQTISDISYPGKTFEDLDSAFDYCNANCEKWSGIAVKYKEASKDLKENKKLLKIEAAIKDCRDYIREIEQKTYEFKSEIVSDAKSAKSKTIGCKQCESSISRSYLKTMNCPVCQQDLTSETNKTKLAKLAQKKQEASEEEKKLKEKYSETKKEILEKEKAYSEKWLVYGLAAC